MHFASHLKTPYPINSERWRSQTIKTNYIVVDSQNQEDSANQIKWNTNHHSCKINNNCYRYTTNLQIPDENDFDMQILQAQNKVNNLQKECILLENMITKMIKDSTELIVQDRRRERSKSLRKQHRSQPKPCPLHNHPKVSILKQSKLDEIIDFKLSRQSIGTTQINNTLPFSRRQQNCKQIFESKQTTQIKYKAKDKQNTPTKVSNKQNKKNKNSIKERLHC